MGKECFVSVLGFLKKIKLPRFEEDFIQGQAEKALEDAPISYGGRVVNDPRDNPEIKAAKKDLREWMDGEWERHSDPSDGASMSTVDVWDE
jgi:hypothetical protein